MMPRRKRLKDGAKNEWVKTCSCGEKVLITFIGKQRREYWHDLDTGDSHVCNLPESVKRERREIAKERENKS